MELVSAVVGIRAGQGEKDGRGPAEWEEAGRHTVAREAESHGQVSMHSAYNRCPHVR